MRKMEKEAFLKAIRGKLIVSCQALEDEPLHDPYIMGRMAVAAREGGSAAIRANSPEQIAAIQKAAGLPVIALYKRVYPGSEVFITPGMEEVEALMELDPEVIAMDATARPRHRGERLEDFFAKVRARYPDQMFMADISTFEEAVEAEKMGFDLVSTTLSGYTAYTEDCAFPNLGLMKRCSGSLSIPVIAEGGIWSPEELRETMHTGVWAAVVGTAITRPRDITRRFIEVAGIG